MRYTVGNINPDKWNKKCFLKLFLLKMIIKQDGYESMIFYYLNITFLEMEGWPFLFHFIRIWVRKSRIKVIWIKKIKPPFLKREEWIYSMIFIVHHRCFRRDLPFYFIITPKILFLKNVNCPISNIVTWHKIW